MNDFLAYLAIRVIEASHAWSQAARTRFGALIGDFFWFVAGSRRRITLTNLRLCFPQWTEQKRREVGRQTFRNMGRAVLDHGVLALDSREAICEYVEPVGLENMLDLANRPLIMVVPHFMGIDAGGMRIAAELRAAGLYARQRNRVLEEWTHKLRFRFNEPVLIPREGFDLRVAIRSMKAGMPLYYLPDQDYGRQHSIFVPFFGVQAATIPMVSRLAKIAGAKVVMLVTEMTPRGYRVTISPPWQDFPTDDVAADTARMNREIERWVEKMPDQYLWTHRRFKTRPDGEGAIY